jgi:hypothetical protein
MKKLITTPLATATLVAALAAAAAAGPTAPIAQTVHDDPRNVSISHVNPPAKTPVDKSGIDRTFHPDYSQALTVEQMDAAWNAEINRVFETPIAGGG